MKNKKILLGELFFIFILMPIMLILDLSMILKTINILIVISYILYVVIKNHLIRGRSLCALPVKPYWTMILCRFLILILVTVLFMYFSEKEKLFMILKNNLRLWIFIVIFYSVLSVYPQEFLYRSFFFARYGVLFKNPFILIAVNGLLFSFAHIFFNNLLVLVLTLLGGVVFGITYFKTKSLLLTSLEHALYGSWLFTVGMGEMLAFPSQ